LDDLTIWRFNDLGFGDLDSGVLTIWAFNDFAIQRLRQFGDITSGGEIDVGPRWRI
jgi:hypothetical protein